MKTILLRLAMLLATLGGRAFAAEPPVTFSVDPLENGMVFYAPMGAVSADDPPTGRLWFSVNITNSGMSTLTLTSIRVQMTGIDISIPQDLDCPANETTKRNLADEEIITVPHPAPASVTFRLYFAGNPTPKTLQRSLVPYEPATPNGQYLYPADEGDIGPDEYFSAGAAHGPGGQMWGSDWQVYRVDSHGDTSTLRAGRDGSVNADSLGWGVPIRAIADGVVLRTTSGYVNNPVPGKLAFQKMDEYDGEAISDVKVTRLSSTRAASLQRLPSGNVQLSIWETANDGRQLTRLGSSGLQPTESVLDMALDELSKTRVAGVLRLANDNLRIVIWDISTDGMNVTNMWSVNRGGVSDVSLTRMSSSRFATGVRNASGNLQINVWAVSDSGIQPLATNTAGGATSIRTTRLSDTRLATSLRTTQGALKVIVWDLVGNESYTLERRGEATGEAISRVAATRISDGVWVTAFRTSPGGLLKIARWVASEDGLTLTSELETTAHAIENNALDIAPAKGIHAVTASMIAGDIFQINGWRYAPDDSPNNFQFHADNTAGVVNTVSLDELDAMEYFVGTRTAGGALKITTWHYANGGGNSVILLHGNCRVLYAHFQDGSVDTNALYPGATVAAGQMIGRMGHSGSSGGPHTHINSDRIDDSRSIEEIIEDEAEFARTDDASKLRIIGPRPMPFSGARAMRLSQIEPGGEGNPGNSFATMNGQGMYDISLGIRPRLNTRYLDRNSTGLNPTGGKEVPPGFPRTGGPFNDTVAQAVGAVSPGTRLYIRGGTYNEAITLNNPMTIRRYDYHRTAGSVVINP